MKKIRLMCLFIAMFGLVSAGTVYADRGKHYYSGDKHFYGGGKHFKHFKHHKHHKHHYRGGRYLGLGYYGERNHFYRSYYHDYGGYGYRFSLDRYFPQHYTYSPVVVIQKAPPPVYIQ